MDQPTPLDQVLGAGLKRLRESNALLQEDVAAEARRLGIPWLRGTVAAIETGRRQISSGELILLPLILGRAGVWAEERTDFRGPHGVERLLTGRHPIGIADLFPDDDTPILVAGATHAPASTLSALFVPAGHQRRRGWPETIRTPKETVEDETAEAVLRLPREWTVQIVDGIKAQWAARTPPRTWADLGERDSFWRRLGLDAANEAERKAASVLGVPALAVALAAHRRWEWSLTAEREHRLAGRFPGLGVVEISPRKLQAVRGHLTRELLDELRPVLEGATEKKPKASKVVTTRKRRPTKRRSEAR